jgi:DNA-directed RNA polymerase subunit RPC12/RpoP
MRMRVIGDNSKEVENEITCHNCGVKIGYLPIDTTQRRHTDYSGDTETYTVIVCPKCGDDIRVSR